MMVVLYHLWPERLPGGYAGVDVFFVISGFLITAHLLREVTRDHRVDLPAFWARRARRLLPAALLVLVVSAIGTLVFVPQTFWLDFFAEMGGAVFYVVNWQLAFNAVDYLAAENNASPVQHYWSLAAEEQFYILWPLLIVLALWIARRRGDGQRAILFTLSIVTGVSLVFSVVLTETNPSLAYFITPTRAWEFGLGGLLAFAPVAGPALLRTFVAWLGAVGIALTGFVYSAETPFPGWQALLPVAATAAVIWAGTTEQPGSFAQLARFRPVHYLGDISYSVYLWHWPPIVIMPYVLGRDYLVFADKLAILVATIALAALSKRFVEDTIRSAGAFVKRPSGYTLRWATAAMVIAVAVPGGGFVAAQSAREAAAAEIAAIDVSAECVGADALLNADCAERQPVPAAALVPDLAALKADTGNAYFCYTPSPQDGELKRCAYGSDAPDATRVALTGDSHAAMLLPALEPFLQERNWRLTTFVGRGCTWAESDVSTECRTYRAKLAAALGEFDIILTTARRQPPELADEVQDIAEERARAWRAAIDDGAEVVAIADNPMLPEGEVDCVVEHPERAAAGDACVLPKDVVTKPVDPMYAASELEPRAHFIDLTDAYCSWNGCPMVAGGVVVYRDQHHLTATYARSVAPVLLARIDEALAAE
jgi:peptidoglycan/LPS O-acetylase OafA/YrhL